MMARILKIGQDEGILKENRTEIRIACVSISKCDTRTAVFYISYENSISYDKH